MFHHSYDYQTSYLNLPCNRVHISINLSSFSGVMYPSRINRSMRTGATSVTNFIITYTHHLPNPQFGLNAPARSFSITLSWFMNYTQSAMPWRCNVYLTSKHSTSPSRGLGANFDASTPAGIAMSYTYSISGCNHPFDVLGNSLVSLRFSRSQITHL